MKVNKKEKRIIEAALHQWKQDGKIEEGKAKQLAEEMVLESFDWKNLALYSFVIALLSLIVGVFSVLADEIFMEAIESIMQSGNWTRSIMTAFLCGITLFVAYRRKKKKVEQQFANEFIYLIAIFFSALSFFYLAKALKLADASYTPIVLLASLIYLFIGHYSKSIVSWLMGLLGLLIVFGLTTELMAEGDYFLGMNVPLRMTLFSFLMLGIFFMYNKQFNSHDFAQVSIVFWFVSLFIFLWVLSITGNYGNYEAWEKVSQMEMLSYSILLGLMSLAAIYFGLKSGLSISREIGIVFFILNLYTRYFELLWDRMHSAIFFFILALSFWLLGKKAEQIWQLGKQKLESNEDRTKKENSSGSS